MAELRIIAPSNQLRAIDPYQQRVLDFNSNDPRYYLSRAANYILKAIGDDIVLNGFDIKNLQIQNNTEIVITLGLGWAIADSTLVTIQEDINLIVDVTGIDPSDNQIFVYLRYKYQDYPNQDNQVKIIANIYNKTNNVLSPNPFLWDPSYDRILLGIIDWTVDGVTGDVLTVDSNNTRDAVIIESNTYYIGGDIHNYNFQRIINEAVANNVPNFIELPAQLSPPATKTSTGFLYTQQKPSGVTELFYRADIGPGNGTTVQLTLDGEPYLKQYVDSNINNINTSIDVLQSTLSSYLIGTNWQDSVDSFYTKDEWVSSPSTAVDSAYICANTTANPLSWTSGYIYRSNGDGTWTETSPLEGMATWVEDEDRIAVWNGTQWVKMSSILQYDYIPMKAQPSDPAARSDTGILFTIKSGTTVDLFYRFNSESGASTIKLSDTTPSNVQQIIHQTSHGFNVGQALYFDGAQYQLADASDPTKLGVFVVSEVLDVDNFKIASIGKIGGLSNLESGKYYYVSVTTPGTLTTIEPTSGYSNPLMVALGTTQGYVLPLRASRVEPVSTLIKGYLTSKIEYYNTSNILIKSGEIDIGGVTYTIASDIIFPVTISDPLKWYYLFAGSPSSGDIITSADISVSTISPVYDFGRRGFYDINDNRCFGVFLSNTSNEVHPFDIIDGWWFIRANYRNFLSTSSPASAKTAVPTLLPGLGKLVYHLYVNASTSGSGTYTVDICNDTNVINWIRALQIEDSSSGDPKAIVFSTDALGNIYYQTNWPGVGTLQMSWSAFQLPEGLKLF